MQTDFNLINYNYNNFISGFIGGCLSVWVGQPFDTLKVWKQNNDLKLKQVLKNVKLKNLYSGWKYPLITEACLNSYLFGVNDIVLKQIGNQYSDNQVANNFISGGLTGITYGLLVNPIELYKIRNQFNNTQNQISFKNPYRGIWVTIPRDIVGCAAFFGPYEYLRQRDYHPLISGGITGVVCWSTLYPFDVIKTRVQSDMSISYLDAIKQKRFYSGIHFCLTRALISNSILFYSYEICLDLLKDR